MNYLSLLIDGQLAHLKEGTEISLEGNNPLFSDAGSKTYLFQLHVDSNRHLFGNSDEVFGDSYFDVIDGKDATLYISGVPMISGVVSLEDEVYIDDDGCIAINIVSGSLEFSQMIEGMNCRDVELLDDIRIGNLLESARLICRLNTEEFKGFVVDGRVISDDEASRWVRGYYLDLPAGLIDVTNYNVSDPYPDAKFCSIRRCRPYSDNLSYDARVEINEQLGAERVTVETGMISLGLGSLSSPPCMYVLYFIDCLVKKLGISLVRNDLLNYKDAKRLAFVNTKCAVRTGEWGSVTADSIANKTLIHARPEALWLRGNQTVAPGPIVFESGNFHGYEAFLTSENFPDASVDDVIEAISSMFNVSFVFDKSSMSLSIVSKKDVLVNPTCEDIYSEVYDSVKVENRIKGFKLMYSSSDKKNTDYTTDMVSHFTPVNSYASVISKVSSFEDRFFIDTRNGNAYAIKIEEEAAEEGDEKKLYPSLFEIGAFAPATYGDCSDEGATEVIKLNFNPIINNDFNGRYNMLSGATREEQIENKYAFLLPDIDDVSYESLSMETKVGPTVFARRKSDDSPATEYSFKWRFYFYNLLGNLSYSGVPQTNDYDTGLMLGIMRGPGSKANYEYYDKDFDGEGNYRVAFKSANYAFTADSIDNCNRDFDYNGDMAGGATEADLEGRISLKLRAGKFYKDGTQVTDDEGNPIPIDGSRANRGLYDKFWKEYAYFSVNKKIVRLRLRMEISELISLDWLRHYKIGDYVGLVSSWSVSVSSEGMSEVDIDLYYL